MMNLETKRAGKVPARSAVVSIAALLLCLAAPAAAQQSPAAQRGLTYVRVHCAQCHAVDRVSESPLAVAPPFRTLVTRHSLDSLRRRLSEGIVATHPTMPQFRLEPDQLADVMAYLQTLAP
jgi:mono/diheme cytochrome c family protein